MRELFEASLSLTHQTKRNELNYKNFEELSNRSGPEMQGLLQLTLQAAIAIWDSLIVSKVLMFSKNLGLKLVLEHDVIVMALGRILNANNDKPDFQILRDILRFPVVVEIRINIDTISDYKTKSHIKSRKIF
jgi:hypothetical protein